MAEAKKAEEPTPRPPFNIVPTKKGKKPRRRHASHRHMCVHCIMANNSDCNDQMPCNNCKGRECVYPPGGWYLNHAEAEIMYKRKKGKRGWVFGFKMRNKWKRKTREALGDGAVSEDDDEEEDEGEVKISGKRKRKVDKVAVEREEEIAIEEPVSHHRSATPEHAATVYAAPVHTTPVYTAPEYAIAEYVAPENATPVYTTEYTIPPYGWMSVNASLRDNFAYPMFYELNQEQIEAGVQGFSFEDLENWNSEFLHSRGFERIQFPPFPMEVVEKSWDNQDSTSPDCRYPPL